MKTKLWAFLAVGEALALVIILSGWRPGFFPDFNMCGGSLSSAAFSPDGRWKAYAFERDCGATTRSSSFVILRDAKRPLDLSAPLEPNEIVFAADGDWSPALRWTSLRELRVLFSRGGAPARAEIFEQVVKRGDHSIRFEGLS